MAKRKSGPRRPPEANRLAAAQSYGRGLGAAIRAALPEPAPKRDNKILTSWTDAELQRIKDASERRGGEPLAVVVRNLTLAALDALSER